MIFLVLIAVTQIVNAQLQGVMFDVCSGGAKCYNRNASLDVCGINPNNPYDIPQYCVINGAPQPDPQIGYAGPCINAGTISDNICIDCSSNEICTLGNLLITNYTLDINFADTAWTSGYTPCAQGNYIVPNGLGADFVAGTVYTQCVPFTLCTLSDSSSVAWACQTPKQFYTEVWTEQSQDLCFLIDDNVEPIYSTNTGLSLGICPRGLICLPFNSNGACVVPTTQSRTKKMRPKHIKI